MTTEKVNMPTKRSLAKRWIRGVVPVILAVAPTLSLGVNWPNRTVKDLQSTYIGADCFYFTLEGVAEADPVNPGSPWFAIPRSQYGAKDAYAMLLTAKLTGKTVLVSSNGAVTCGYAAVSQVLMQ